MKCRISGYVVGKSPILLICVTPPPPKKKNLAPSLYSEAGPYPQIPNPWIHLASDQKCSGRKFWKAHTIKT
jgi:hypothetical protein